MKKMNTVKQDRATLKRLVESYGKKDVIKYINHLDEVIQRVPYIVGGTQWAEDIIDDNGVKYRGDYRTNPAYLARITNDEDVPDLVMESLYQVLRYGDVIYDIAYRDENPKNSKYTFLRDLDVKTAQAICTQMGPIFGLFANKTNFKDDDYRIMPDDLIEILPNLKYISNLNLGLFSKFAFNVVNAIERYKKDQTW